MLSRRGCNVFSDSENLIWKRGISSCGNRVCPPPYNPLVITADLDIGLERNTTGILLRRNKTQNLFHLRCNNGLGRGLENWVSDLQPLETMQGALSAMRLRSPQLHPEAMHPTMSPT